MSGLQDDAEDRGSVETGDQLTRLKKMECDLAQGFYFWKPAPAETTAELLAEQHRS